MEFLVCIFFLLIVKIIEWTGRFMKWSFVTGFKILAFPVVFVWKMIKITFEERQLEKSTVQYNRVAIKGSDRCR